MNWQDILYWISMTLLWFAFGLNIYMTTVNRRVRKNLELALKNTENMRVEYERARDAHFNRLNELSENRKD